MPAKRFIIFLCVLIGNILALRGQNAYSPVSKMISEATEATLPIYSGDCSNTSAVNIIIDEAISSGAPTYNSGNHVGCFRIYEGAAYKILYKYGSKCKEVKNTLEAALEKSYGDYSSTEKAWIMRKAFDSILGVETKAK